MFWAYYVSIYGFTSLIYLGRFLSFLIYTQSIRLLGRGISPWEGRYLHTEQHKQNKSTQTSMPRVGFQSTIPMFERATVRPQWSVCCRPIAGTKCKPRCSSIWNGFVAYYEYGDGMGQPMKSVGYGLEDRGFGVWWPTGLGNVLVLHRVQTVT
jgi:hypothetical protein